MACQACRPPTLHSRRPSSASHSRTTLRTCSRTFVIQGGSSFHGPISRSRTMTTALARSCKASSSTSSTTNSGWTGGEGDLPRCPQRSRLQGKISRPGRSSCPSQAIASRPAEPCRCGNPVFSIVQTDIIYYGANLAHSLLNEFVDRAYELHTHAQEIRKIRIWSYLAEDWNWQLDDRRADGQVNGGGDPFPRRSGSINR